MASGQIVLMPHGRPGGPGRRPDAPGGRGVAFGAAPGRWLAGALAALLAGAAAAAAPAGARAAAGPAPVSPPVPPLAPDLPPLAPPSTSSLEVRIERIDIQSFPLIRSFLTILDATGKAVPTLERRSFQLSENGARCRFDSLKIDRTPLSVALLVDASGSMLPALLEAKRAVAHFIRVLEPHDQAMLLSFAESPQLLVPSTLDQDRLVMALGPIEAYGPTALYDALHKAALDLAAQPGRRLVLLLTDGQDQNAAGTARQSRHTLAECLDAARAGQVVVHVVALGRHINEAELARIAGETRGQLFRTARSQDLEAIYLAISRNLKSRVELDHRSPDPRVEGSWRAVEVRVAAAGVLGSDQAAYRAPGRYLLEVPGQGFDRLRLPELAREVPPVRLRDLNLKEILMGGSKEISEWIETYFKKRKVGP
jgi:Ca-activated chloride channel family protein